MNADQKAYEIRGSHFPFGSLSSQPQCKKTYVKKRYAFRSAEEYAQMMEKVEKLKGISHKNTINLRWITQNQNSIDAFYQYVPLSLEDSFMENPTQTVKEMHRQFIELAIYLAKNFIATSFEGSRCGVVIAESKGTLKYYLPLNQITVTDNRTALERSVQLFNVQAMHYLDTLASQCASSIDNENCSQRTFKNRVKLFPKGKQERERRDSQPSGTYDDNNRRLTNNPSKESQIRKLSTLSRELSQISRMHKKRGASTRVSGQSFRTLRSIQSFKSHENTVEQGSRTVMRNTQQTLKRCLSQNGIIENSSINTIIERSRRALDSLNSLKQKMSSYKDFFHTFLKIKEQL